ncbi:MAG: hypothetical protein ACLFN0_03725 [Thermovirgaceae bacterium]
MTVFFLPKKFRTEDLPTVASELTWLQSIFVKDFSRSFDGNKVTPLAAAGIVESLAYLSGGDISASDILSAAKVASKTEEEAERLALFTKALAGLWFGGDEESAPWWKEESRGVRDAVRSVLRDIERGRNPRRILANAALGFMTRPDMVQYRRDIGIDE